MTNNTEIMHAIKRIKVNKASAWDKISDTLLSYAKENPDSPVIDFIKDIINQIFYNKTIPDEISIGRMIVFKKVKEIP